MDGNGKVFGGSYSELGLILQRLNYYYLKTYGIPVKELTVYMSDSANPFFDTSRIEEVSINGILVVLMFPEGLSSPHSTSVE